MITPCAKITVHESELKCFNYELFLLINFKYSFIRHFNVKLLRTCYKKTRKNNKSIIFVRNFMIFISNDM